MIYIFSVTAIVIPSGLLPVFDGVDQGVGGRVMAADRAAAAEFRQDFFRELFAEFDPHLVEGVDIPDDALGEDFVFVERD